MLYGNQFGGKIGEIASADPTFIHRTGIPKRTGSSLDYRNTDGSVSSGDESVTSHKYVISFAQVNPDITRLISVSVYTCIRRKSAYVMSLSFFALAFHNELEYRNADMRINSRDDLTTSKKIW